MAFCEKQRKPVPVACPTLFPARREPARPRDRHDLSGRDFTPPGYPGYLVNFNDTAAPTDDLGHIILAAQPRPFSLAGQPGAAWPRIRPDPEMRIVTGTLLRRTSVHGLPAILVRSRRYPAGGIHGGHILVVWNERRRGYLVSFHYRGGTASYTEQQRIGAALAIAVSTSWR
jgi:hypothetical protein